MKDNWSIATGKYCFIYLPTYLHHYEWMMFKNVLRSLTIYKIIIRLIIFFLFVNGHTSSSTLHRHCFHSQSPIIVCLIHLHIWIKFTGAKYWVNKQKSSIRVNDTQTIVFLSALAFFSVDLAALLYTNTFVELFSLFEY